MATAPAASSFTFSAADVTMDGGSVNISIMCTNNAYSHKLRHAFGTIATLAAGNTSYKWVPTAAQLTKFWAEVPNQKSRQINVMLDTYNGSTLVGTATRTLNIILSEVTGKPVYNSYTFTDSNTVAKNMGIWVYGKSKTSTTTYNGEFKYGSKYDETTWHPGSPFNNAPGYNNLADALNWAAGLSEDPVQVSIESKIKDSRGLWSNVVTNKYYVANYKAPHLDVFEVLRCNASGAEDDNGTKAKVTVKGSWSAMKVGTTYKNAAILKVGYRVAGSTGAYTFQNISVTGGTVNVSQLLTVTLAANADYEFSAIFSDTFSESDARSEVGFSNVGNILYVSPDGKQVVIGSDTGNNVSIDEDSLDIRDKSTVLATFTKDNIKLGTDAATINMPYLSIRSASSGGTQLAAPSGFHVEACPAHSGKFAYIDTSGYKKQYGFSESDAFVRLMANVVLGAGSVPKSAIITASAKYNGNSQIDLDADNVTLYGEPIVDFVQKQGWSGDWYYRQWKSGKAECWANVKTSGFNSGWSAQGGNWIKVFTKALPFTGKSFISAQASTDYYGFATVNGPQNAQVNNWLTTFSTCICEINGSEGVDNEHCIQMYWLGTWK